MKLKRKKINGYYEPFYIPISVLLMFAFVTIMMCVTMSLQYTPRLRTNTTFCEIINVAKGMEQIIPEEERESLGLPPTEETDKTSTDENNTPDKTNDEIVEDDATVVVSEPEKDEENPYWTFSDFVDEEYETNELLLSISNGDLDIFDSTAEEYRRTCILTIMEMFNEFSDVARVEEVKDVYDSISAMYTLSSYDSSMIEFAKNYMRYCYNSRMAATHSDFRGTGVWDDWYIDNVQNFIDSMNEDVVKNHVSPMDWITTIVPFWLILIVFAICWNNIETEDDKRMFIRSVKVFLCAWLIVIGACFYDYTNNYHYYEILGSRYEYSYTNARNITAQEYADLIVEHYDEFQSEIQELNTDCPIQEAKRNLSVGLSHNVYDKAHGIIKCTFSGFRNFEDFIKANIDADYKILYETYGGFVGFFLRQLPTWSIGVNLCLIPIPFIKFRKKDESE